MGDLYNQLGSEDHINHIKRSQEVWDEICGMAEPIRERLRERAGKEINIDKCEFLGKHMCDFLVKQRMIGIIKGYPVPKI